MLQEELKKQLTAVKERLQEQEPGQVTVLQQFMKNQKVLSPSVGLTRTLALQSGSRFTKNSADTHGHKREHSLNTWTGLGMVPGPSPALTQSFSYKESTTIVFIVHTRKPRQEESK